LAWAAFAAAWASGIDTTVIARRHAGPAAIAARIRRFNGDVGLSSLMRTSHGTVNGGGSSGQEEPFIETKIQVG
jgi:hypothetical protein